MAQSLNSLLVDGNDHGSGSRHPLTLEQVRQYAPSVFATKPREDVSAKYAFIDSARVVEQLGEQGFRPALARQSRCLNPDGKAFVGHMLRFRHETAFGRPNEDCPEIVWLNSHDRSTIGRFLVGVFRPICTNGLISSTGDFTNVAFRHLGGENVRNAINDAISLVAQQANETVRSIATWKQIVVPVQAQLQLATRALVELKPNYKIEPKQLLEAQREADYAAENGDRDLWTAFNVIQEHLIRGGDEYRTASGRRNSTRAVKSIVGEIQANRGLWNFAHEYALAQ